MDENYNKFIELFKLFQFNEIYCLKAFKLNDISNYKLVQLQKIAKNRIKYYYKFRKKELYQLLKIIESLYKINEFYIRNIGNIYDPITKDPINTNKCFKYFYNNGKCIRYNINSIYEYINSTYCFKDPMSNIEYNEIEINRMNKIFCNSNCFNLIKTHSENSIKSNSSLELSNSSNSNSSNSKSSTPKGSNLIIIKHVDNHDLNKLYKNREQLQYRKNSDEDNILSIETILSDIVKEILEIIETPIDYNQIINDSYELNNPEFLENNPEFLENNSNDSENLMMVRPPLPLRREISNIENRIRLRNENNYYVIEQNGTDFEFLCYTLLPLFSQYIDILISMTSNEYSNGLIKSFLEYIKGPKNKETPDPNKFKNYVLAFIETTLINY